MVGGVLDGVAWWVVWRVGWCSVVGGMAAVRSVQVVSYVNCGNTYYCVQVYIYTFPIKSLRPGVYLKNIPFLSDEYINFFDFESLIPKGKRL